MPKKPTTKKAAPKAKSPSPMMMSKKQMGSMANKKKNC